MSRSAEPLRLAAGVARRLVEHARREAPRECCGLLAGRGRRVDLVLPLPNVAPTPRTRFFAEPRALVAAMRRLREEGRTLLGIYHSHPAAPPVPSETDRAEASYPDCAYVIVGSIDGEPELRAFRLAAGDVFREVPILVDEADVARGPA